MQDYALFLLDVDGNVVAWYSGAERIYGYTGEEAIGQHVSLLYPSEDTLQRQAAGRAEAVRRRRPFRQRRLGMRKDGSRFWANIITMALKDENGELQGFARVVRDFSERHERDREVAAQRGRVCRPLPVEATIAGIVSGEFDRIPEANDAFLELVGYSREDLLAGRLQLARSHSAGILCAG